MKSPQQKLYDACRTGNLKEVIQAIEDGAQVDTLIAAEDKHLNLVQPILQQNLALYHGWAGGYSPLLIVADNQSFDIFMFIAKIQFPGGVKDIPSCLLDSDSFVVMLCQLKTRTRQEIYEKMGLYNVAHFLNIRVEIRNLISEYLNSTSIQVGVEDVLKNRVEEQNKQLRGLETENGVKDNWGLNSYFNYCQNTGENYLSDNSDQDFRKSESYCCQFI